MNCYRTSIMEHIGIDAFIRMCKNYGLSFETAYFLRFGRMPRI